MILTPVSGNPVCNISGTVHGQAFSANLVLPEGFTINGSGVHLPTANPDGSPHYAGSGTWIQPVAGVDCFYSCALTDSPALSYSTLLAVKGNYIELAFTIRNNSGVSWDSVSAAICCFNLSQNPNLVDSIGTYTWVPHDPGTGCGWQTLASLFAQPIGQWALYVDNPLAPPSIRACGTMLCRMSQDQQQYVGVGFEHSPMISGNMASYAMCLHSNPLIGPLSSGDSITQRGRICLDESSVANFASNVLVT